MRIKLVIISVLLLLQLQVLFSIENSRYYYWSDAGGDWFFEFTNETFTLYDYSQLTDSLVPLPGFEDDIQGIQVTGKYTIENFNNSSFLVVSNKRYLILVNSDKFCFLYEVGNNKNAYFGVNSKYLQSQRRKTPQISTPEFEKYIRISDKLNGGTRDGIRYSPPFSRISYESVWAFPIQQGINNWIELYSFHKTNSILICSGFIYPGNIQYYYNNSRPKTILLTNNGNSQQIILNDTPAPQLITLERSIDSESFLKITIIDYYLGTRYNDCVISFIGFLGSQM